jgi:hypothetical protein
MLSRLMTMLRHWMTGASVEGCLEINPASNRDASRNDLMVSVNPYASTLKALQGRGLIRAAKGHDPLTIVWRLTNK